jgi:hypothetical protein
MDARNGPAPPARAAGGASARARRPALGDGLADALGVRALGRQRAQTHHRALERQEQIRAPGLQRGLRRLDAVEVRGYEHPARALPVAGLVRRASFAQPRPRHGEEPARLVRPAARGERRHGALVGEHGRRLALRQSLRQRGP